MRHNQNRRSRGRNNNRKGPNPLTRSYESNGPDVKVRGTAIHVAEKYMSLARDAQSSGDIVAAENYLQHAEHYNRIVMAAQAQFQQAQQPQFREGGDEAYDDERQMNGRPARDRFDFNGDGARDEEEGEIDRFDSTEEEQERGFQPQQPRQHGARPNDRDRQQRGPRPDRFDRRDRPERGDRGPRPDDDRGSRQERFGRPDRSDERAESPRAMPPQPGEPMPEAGPAEAAVAPSAPSAPSYPESEAAPVRRRRSRPPRPENGADAQEPAGSDATTDGAAALAAFPE